MVSEELSVPLISYDEWLTKLEARAGTLPDLRVEDLEEVPALRLLSFYRALKHGYKEGGNALGFPELETSCAVAASPTLADPRVPQITSDIVKGWLKSWRAGGGLHAASC